MDEKELKDIGEDGVKSPPKKRPNKSNDMSVHTTKEENKRYVRHALAVFDMPPIDISDPEQVKARIEWYFRHCETDGMKPTVAGVCNSLGIDRTTFYRWGVGELRGKTPEYSNMVKRVRGIIWELWEQYAADGKVNPVTFIFLMKNHFGYADKQEISLTSSSQYGEEPSREALEAKYRESVIVDTDGEEVD